MQFSYRSEDIKGVLQRFSVALPYRRGTYKKEKAEGLVKIKAAMTEIPI